MKQYGYLDQSYLNQSEVELTGGGHYDVPRHGDSDGSHHEDGTPLTNANDTAVIC